MVPTSYFTGFLTSQFCIFVLWCVHCRCFKETRNSPESETPAESFYQSVDHISGYEENGLRDVRDVVSRETVVDMHVTGRKVNDPGLRKCGKERQLENDLGECSTAGNYRIPEIEMKFLGGGESSCSSEDRGGVAKTPPLPRKLSVHRESQRKKERGENSREQRENRGANYQIPVSEIRKIARNEGKTRNTSRACAKLSQAESIDIGEHDENYQYPEIDLESENERMYEADSQMLSGLSSRDENKTADYQYPKKKDESVVIPLNTAQPSPQPPVLPPTISPRSQRSEASTPAVSSQSEMNLYTQLDTVGRNNGDCDYQHLNAQWWEGLWLFSFVDLVFILGTVLTSNFSVCK